MILQKSKQFVRHICALMGAVFVIIMTPLNSVYAVGAMSTLGGPIVQNQGTVMWSRADVLRTTCGKNAIHPNAPFQMHVLLRPQAPGTMSALMIRTYTPHGNQDHYIAIKGTTTVHLNWDVRREDGAAIYDMQTLYTYSRPGNGRVMVSNPC